MDDIDELDRLNEIEQKEKEAEAARKRDNIEWGLGIFTGLFKDITGGKKSSNGTGNGTAAPGVLMVPGTQIKASTFIIPAAIIGGVMLLTSRRRRR